MNVPRPVAGSIRINPPAWGSAPPREPRSDPSVVTSRPEALKPIGPMTRPAPVMGSTCASTPPTHRSRDRAFRPCRRARRGGAGTVEARNVNQKTSGTGSSGESARARAHARLLPCRERRLLMPEHALPGGVHPRAVGRPDGRVREPCPARPCGALQSLPESRERRTYTPSLPSAPVQTRPPRPESSRFRTGRYPRRSPGSLRSASTRLVPVSTDDRSGIDSE